MSRRCDFTGRGVQTGNNVSHSNRRTRRRWLPNMQIATVDSEILERGFRVRLASRAIRTIEHKGGLDAFLLSTPDRKLGETALKIKREVVAAHEASQQEA